MKWHIASVSWGKDSLAMLLTLIAKGYPLNEVVFYDTGMEFEAIYHTRDQMLPCLEQLGIKYTRLEPENPFLFDMLERPVCSKQKGGLVLQERQRMNKTKIDWATMSWNPVTGCRHGCPYCYARRTATRFNAGLEDPAPLAGGLHVLPEKIKATPYPYGFEPTLHRYRLGQPQNTKEPQTVFVCSMADLFGRWVPTSWIVEVLDACRKAPQHRYLFLTKNPARYLELDHLALLPHESNFWYGSTVANMDAVGMYVMQGVNINSFWSMEPLLGPVDMAAAEGLPEWVILGAETGNRPDKVTPAREWVDNIVAFCEENEIPVFFKDNLRKYFPDLPASAFPWEV